jgi:exodeoxyribonuclease VII large subunit
MNACATIAGPLWFDNDLEQFDLDFGPARRVYTVSELNSLIRGLLDREFSDIWVSGEISGAKLAASGHLYFTLKEREAQLRCVCFRSNLRYLRFKPQDGLAVLARGRIDVFEQRGEYQLLVEAMEPQGHGALQLAFEQLKRKLAAEGLFDAARKRPLPEFPRRIGIVTSPRGAAIADMLEILSRRFPGLHIRLFPAQVQGAGSMEDVCRGIRYFSTTAWADVVIVGRGGGSLEDLWTFNEEAVARAIAGCAVPVISAVGHETDFTIADFVADLRAPTPSAAAEMVICTRQELLDRMAATRARAVQFMRYRLAMFQRRLQQRGIDRAAGLLHRSVGRRLQRVDEYEYRLREVAARRLAEKKQRRHALEDRLRYFDPTPRLATVRRRLETSAGAALQVMRLHFVKRRGRLEALEGKLSQLSPLRVLERGYAIVHNQAGGVVKDSEEAPAGARIFVRLARGRLRARVEDAGR